ncbi:MAG: hypothetical protein ACOYN2_00625 [Patescibacteria group bacterium]
MSVTTDQFSTSTQPAVAPVLQTGVPAVDAMLERAHAGVDAQVPLEFEANMLASSVAGLVGNMLNLSDSLNEKRAEQWSLIVNNANKLRARYGEAENDSKYAKRS